MKYIVLVMVNLFCCGAFAQSDSTVVIPKKEKKNPQQHFGLFAGGGYSLLNLKVNEQVVADSGVVIPSVTAKSSWNFNAGFFISAETGPVILRPSLSATFSPTELVYDFNHPVNETHDIFPVTVDAAFHISGKSLRRTKPRLFPDTVMKKWWTPVLGFNAGFPIEMFNGSHPAMQSSRLSIEGGMALRLEKKVRGNLHQRRSLELLASFNLNNLKKEDDDLRSAVVSEMHKHAIILRFYFQ